MHLSQVVIAITGAGSGIGRACALAYARNGATVAVTDVDIAAAQAVVDEIVAQNHPAAAWALDVTNRAAIPETIASIARRFRRVDVWHNNAGVSTMRRFVDLTEHDWDVNMGVNAKGAFNCSQAIARYFVEHRIEGRIINTASMAGKRGNVPFLAHYVASKFAVVGLTQATAAELAPYGITVNAICPGYVATAMQEREAAWEGALRGISADAVRELYVADTPLSRLQTAEDVAGVAVFLASPESGFLTGESININGGAFMD